MCTGTPNDHEARADEIGYGAVFQDDTAAGNFCIANIISTVANLKFYEDKAYMVAWGITGFCNGDGNGDGVVDGIDFIYIRDSFLKSYPGDYDGTTGPGKYNPAGDYNMDGVVDGIDFIALRNAFLGAPPDNCTTKSWPQ